MTYVVFGTLTSSFSIIDDEPWMKDSWSYPVVQMLSLREPRYFVGVKADGMGSYEPISSAQASRSIEWSLANMRNTHKH